MGVAGIVKAVAVVAIEAEVVAEALAGPWAGVETGAEGHRVVWGGTWDWGCEVDCCAGSLVVDRGRGGAAKPSCAHKSVIGNCS
jgi:hypothetical protein